MYRKWSICWLSMPHSLSPPRGVCSSANWHQKSRENSSRSLWINGIVVCWKRWVYVTWIIILAHKHYTIILMSWAHILQKYYQGIQSTAVDHDTQSKYQWKVTKIISLTLISCLPKDKLHMQYTVILCFSSVCLWIGLWWAEEHEGECLIMDSQHPGGPGGSGQSY